MEGRIAFIVEGTKREHKIVENLRKEFSFPNIDIIELSCGNNIYNLYTKLKQDDFFTDVIEVLRELSTDNQKKLLGLSASNFQEIYLFFDFDFQELYHRESWDKQKACDVVNELLVTFDNETELGKLYISYPMVEAFFDMNKVGCVPATGECHYSAEHGALKSYKEAVSNAIPKYMDVSKYVKEDWSRICSMFIVRCCCLIGEYDNITVEKYREHNITPKCIFQRIKEQVFSGNKIFILSAIPEFLLDYYKKEKIELYINKEIGFACNFIRASLS